MQTPADTDVLSSIAGLLNAPDIGALQEALRLSYGLPGPGTAPKDTIAQVLFDLGFCLEGLEQNEQAIGVYRRVVAYPVADKKITAGAWFRLAFLWDRLCNWLDASSAYRRALELAPEWTYMAILAQYRLATIVAAEENYAEAASLCEAVESAPAHPDLPLPKIRLELGRWLLRGGQREAAQRKLEQLLEAFPESPEAIDANQLLAEAHEHSGNLAKAVECYSRIVANASADPALKGASAYRIVMLRRTKARAAR